MNKVYFNNTDLQVNFLIKVLNINIDSIGLDVGCGVGEQLEKLQVYAPNTYGVDIHNICNNKNFIKSDIFHDLLEFSDTLDFAYVLSPYFGTEWNSIEVLFSKLYKYLKKDGLFLLDLFNYNTTPIGSFRKDFELLDDKIILTTFERTEKSITAKRTFKSKDWSEKYKELYWRVFEYNELKQIAQKSGFEMIDSFKNFDYNQKGVWEPNAERSRLSVLFKKVVAND